MRLVSSSPRRSAFTLVEILVVIAIIALLAALAIPSFNSARLSASRAKSAGNLKNFGAAIYTFAADNNGMMPGADGGNAGTLSGISPIAKSAAANSLQVQLMTYLEKERPSGNMWGTFFMKSLAYPAWQGFNKGTSDNQIPAYVACQSYVLPDGSTISPFGGPAKTQRPMRTAALQDKLSSIPSDQPKPYAVIEVDQEILSVLGSSASWRKNLPTNALHGKVRNVLYFDGSVATVGTSNQPKPW
jgi:prepilin-type N-terminal cleavage/methylation domain-containing protein/prepilin-type processing-associated H-X9-DG protein